MIGWIRRRAEKLDLQVKKERYGFLAYGLVLYDLKGLLLLLPIFPAALFMEESTLREIIVWGSFAVWVAYTILVLAFTTRAISRIADRDYDRKTRPTLSSEYRKR